MDGAREAIHARVEHDIDQHLRGTAWTENEKFVLAARILAQEGHCSGLAGQITQRLADGTYATLPIGCGFDEAKPDRMLRVDDQLAVLEGRGVPNPAVRFHLWIYRKRADVKAIVHTHPPKASALSMIGRPLVSAHMDAAMLYDDCAFLAEWPGVPIADEEGRLISAALGDKSTILLAHHGVLATGTTLEEATYLAVCLEHAARLQLDAECAGTIQPIRPEYGHQARTFLRKPAIVNATFAWLARRALRADPDALSV
jgi:L-fuculose-phosphate aldolase